MNQREGLGAKREFFYCPFESDLGQNVQDMGWSLENSPVPAQAGSLGQAGVQHSVTGLQLFKSLFFKKPLCYILASADTAVTVHEMTWTCVSCPNLFPNTDFCRGLELEHGVQQWQGGFFGTCFSGWVFPLTPNA